MHYSICICSDIKIWASDRLPEVTTIEKLKSPALNVVAVAYEKFRLSDLTGRNLVLIFGKIVARAGLTVLGYT